MAVSLLHTQHFGRETPIKLICFHGLFGDGANLGAIARLLSDTIEVVCIDLPDHGLSPHSEHFDFFAWRDAAITTIRSVTNEPFFLLGHSLGGKLAMLVAQQMADCIDHLFILDIAPVNYPASHTKILSALNQLDLEQLKSRQDAVNKLSVSLGGNQEVSHFLAKSLFRNAIGGWGWRFNLELLTRDYELLRQWPDVGCCFERSATLIIGTKSDYVTPTYRDAILSVLPKVKARLIDAGHWLHAEKPEQVVNYIRQQLVEQS